MINIGNGKEITIGELAGTIMRLLGKDLPIVEDDQRIRPTGSEVERLCSDNTKAQRILNWRPRHSIKEGLAETIKWMEGNLRQYRPEMYVV